MSRRGIFLTLLLVIVILTYGVLFGGWFSTETMRITPQIRGGRPSRVERDPSIPPVYPVSFLLSRKYELTSVKVVAAADLATNKWPHPLWHLIADTHSIATKSIVYGNDLEGMKPSIPKRQAEPLEPHVKYVILLETTSGLKGQTNFLTKEIKRAR